MTDLPTRQLAQLAADSQGSTPLRWHVARPILEAYADGRLIDRNEAAAGRGHETTMEYVAAMRIEDLRNHSQPCEHGSSLGHLDIGRSCFGGVIPTRAEVIEALGIAFIADLLDELRGYVDDYFAEKWELDDEITKAKTALGIVEGDDETA